jgi:ribosomal protein S18 acetylase RimI-like enzyme
MDEGVPPIEVRAVRIDDATVLHKLDYSFETDRIYTLRVQGPLAQEDTRSSVSSKPALAFELLETPVDPPLYKDLHEFGSSLAELEARLSCVEGGYIALAGGQVAGVILLNVEEARSVAYIENIIVGRQFRRYGIGSLLLSCASDWARNHACWAILLEIQSVNYPAIQFYLRNGLEVWGMNNHFYPPGTDEHEVAIFMGKKLWSTP